MKYDILLSGIATPLKLGVVYHSRITTSFFHASQFHQLLSLVNLGETPIKSHKIQVKFHLSPHGSHVSPCCFLRFVVKTAGLYRRKEATIVSAMAACGSCSQWREARNQLVLRGICGVKLACLQVKPVVMSK